jgi:putative colanic acid biosynthesis glycosyltransferase
MNKNMLSIITVTYNNLSGLQDTCRSVRSQSFVSYEHVVVDGNSNDGSKEFLNEQFDNPRMTFLSERDGGIFNAMNKGISIASGDWLLFLNAGDTFPADSTLENLSVTGVFEDTELELIYGDKLDSGGICVKAKTDLSCLYFGEMPACHQSIFFRNNIRYDEYFQIFGDIDLLARIYISKPNFKYVQIPVSIFEGGGISSKITWTKRKEKFRSLFSNFGYFCLLRNYVLKPVSYKRLFFWK